MADEIEPIPLTPNQHFLLGLKDIALTLQGNIAFLNQNLKQIPELARGIEANINSINTVLSMMQTYKMHTSMEDYSCLFTLDPNYKAFDEAFLEKKVQFVQPKPKSKIILLGDPL